MTEPTLAERQIRIELREVASAILTFLNSNPLPRPQPEAIVARGCERRGGFCERCGYRACMAPGESVFIPEIIAQLPASKREYFGPILERAAEAARAAKQTGDGA